MSRKKVFVQFEVSGARVYFTNRPKDRSLGPIRELTESDWKRLSVVSPKRWALSKKGDIHILSEEDASKLPKRGIKLLANTLDPEPKPGVRWDWVVSWLLGAGAAAALLAL